MYSLGLKNKQTITATAKEGGAGLRYREVCLRDAQSSGGLRFGCFPLARQEKVISRWAASAPKYIAAGYANLHPQYSLSRIIYVNKLML